jgi:hypothetical protein
VLSSRRRVVDSNGKTDAIVKGKVLLLSHHCVVDSNGKNDAMVTTISYEEEEYKTNGAFVPSSRCRFHRVARQRKGVAFVPSSCCGFQWQD